MRMIEADRVVVINPPRQVHCNILMMNKVLESDLCKLLIEGDYGWQSGECIKFVCYTSSDNQPTGLHCYRYVVHAVNLCLIMDGLPVFEVAFSSVKVRT